MTEDQTDLRILELFRNPAWRKQGFELLVQTYQQPVYRLIRRMVFDHDDTNDVVQDTFIKVWHNLEGFREESKLFSWIYRIASNEALAFIKRRKGRAHVPFEHFENEQGKWMADDHYFKGDEIQKKLHLAIQTLPPQQRIIFNMRYFDDLKYEEISGILNLTEGALKASYHHAVKKIEKFITGD